MIARKIDRLAAAQPGAAAALAFALILGAGVAATPARAQSKDVEESVSLHDASRRDSDTSKGLTASFGADYSTGHYGDPVSTDILILPFNLRLRTSKRLSVSVGLAYVRIAGSNVVLGPDGKPLPGVATARAVHSGLGDVSLSGTYSLITNDSPWLVDVTARVKLPTSSRASGLSTGKVDFSGSAEVTYIVGKWAPYASLGYRVPGKLAGAGLRNSLTASVGTSFIAGKRALIFSYDYEQAISPVAKNGHSLFLAFSAPANKALRITAYGIAGLSAGSPAAEAGLLLSVTL